MIERHPDLPLPTEDMDTRWAMFWRGRMRPVTAMLARGTSQPTGDPQQAGAATLFICPEPGQPGGFEAVAVSPGDILLSRRPRRLIFKPWDRVA